MFALPDQGKCRVVGVTSALRNEGKSTLAINLAYTVGVILFGPVPGLLADRTGSYVPAYLLFAALLTLAIVLVRMAYIRANRQKV